MPELNQQYQPDYKPPVRKPAKPQAPELTPEQRAARKRRFEEVLRQPPKPKQLEPEPEPEPEPELPAPEVLDQQPDPPSKQQPKPEPFPWEIAVGHPVATWPVGVPVPQGIGDDIATINFRRDVLWVYTTFGRKDVRAEDAPSVGAWALRDWAHSYRTEFFKSFLPRAMKDQETGETEAVKYERQSIQDIRDLLQEMLEYEGRSGPASEPVPSVAETPREESQSWEEPEGF